MRAIVYRSYGSADVLELEDVERPTPRDDEVLIRVCAAAANPLDYHLMTGTFIMRPFMGLRRPRLTRPGSDLAGVVEGVGRNVTAFKPGDEVFGTSRGSFAEYVCAKENRVALKPAGIAFEQAAALPVAGLTALQGLRDKGRVQPGQKVLINGAAGGVGTFAVQIAKSFGAEVTGVCGTRNLDFVRSIGADRVIDYTRDDFTRSGERYDLLFDGVGNRPLSACRRVMTPKGTFVAVGVRPGGRWVGPLPYVLKLLASAPFVSQRVVFFIANGNPADLVALTRLIEANKLTPVIDRRYPLSEAREAIRYLKAGHARGKVVISVESHNDSVGKSG